MHNRFDKLQYYIAYSMYSSSICTALLMYRICHANLHSLYRLVYIYVYLFDKPGCTQLRYQICPVNGIEDASLA